MTPAQCARKYITCTCSLAARYLQRRKSADKHTSIETELLRIKLFDGAATTINKLKCTLRGHNILYQTAHSRPALTACLATELISHSE